MNFYPDNLPLFLSLHVFMSSRERERESRHCVDLTQTGDDIHTHTHTCADMITWSLTEMWDWIDTPTVDLWSQGWVCDRVSGLWPKILLLHTYEQLVRHDFFFFHPAFSYVPIFTNLISCLLFKLYLHDTPTCVDVRARNLFHQLSLVDLFSNLPNQAAIS